MNSVNFQKLEQMLQEFISDRDKLIEDIQLNEQKIQETDYFVRSLLDEEAEDVKVFSPRSKNIIYREELWKSRKNKESCELENENYEMELSYYQLKIDTLKEVIEQEKKCDLLSVDKSRNINLMILNMQEEERQRIARELHDTSLQNLAHLLHKIELSSMFIDQDPIRAKLELSVVNKDLKEVIGDIRNTIFDLRPMTFDDLGLKEAIERLLINLNENNKFVVIEDIETIQCENNLILVYIYRIIQECILNAICHSGGNKLHVSCKCKNDICEVIIEDNGRGFTSEGIESKKNQHFGLSVMQERVELLGGTLEIISNLETGTVVHICIPLK